MSGLPLISIIIPVYNGARFLKETITAVLSQSVQDFELLIVNDYSTDDTKNIALAMQACDPRIKYFEKGETGVSVKRNFGLKESRGSFIVFLDSDDVPHSDFLKTRVDFLSVHKEAGACGSTVDIIDEGGNIDYKRLKQRAPGASALEEILFYTPGVTTIPSNLMFRKEVLIKNHITFDKRLSSSADRLFLYKVAQVAGCHCLPNTTLSYRVHAGSMYHNPQGIRNLFEDNQLYIHILLKKKLVPASLMPTFLRKSYYMLAGAALKAKMYDAVLTYGLKYLWARIKY